MVDEQGLTKLQIEIAAGEGPDLIDFGGHYSNRAVASGMAENLYPYMEANSAFKQEEYFENVWDSFAIGQNLYAMPTEFSLRSLATLKESVGELNSWDARQMQHIYENRPSGILYPGETKLDVFAFLCYKTMDTFIDWDQGTCQFDSEEFKNLVRFSNLFPETLIMANDYSALDAFSSGQALIYPLYLGDIYGITEARMIFGNNEITFIGYPVENDISGNLIDCGNRSSMLAISANSKNKELAWDVLKTVYSEEFQRRVNSFPMRKDILEERLEDGMQIKYETDTEGKEIMKPMAEIVFEYEDPIPIFSITQEDKEALLQIIEYAEVSTAVDEELCAIFTEEIGAYFSGEKDVETVVDIIQRRASIYVSEKVD